MVTNVQFAVLENDVKALKKEISKINLEMKDMRIAITEMKISQARTAVIMGLTQTVGTGLMLWIFRSALVGG